MPRRTVRALWPLVLLLLLMGGRAAGCRKKGAAATAKPSATVRGHWITPLMTMPPPRPTVTMWKGVTRAPELPE